MDFSREISAFCSARVGSLYIVKQADGLIYYADEALCAAYGALCGAPAVRLPWGAELPRPAESEEWEYVDSAHQRFYRILGATFEKEGERYDIHMVTDATPLIDLNREVAQSTAFFQRLARFQTALSGLLSREFAPLLACVRTQLQLPALWLMQQDAQEVVVLHSTEAECTARRVSIWEAGWVVTEEGAFAGAAALGLPPDALRLCGGLAADTQPYALYAAPNPAQDNAFAEEGLVQQVVRLNVENQLFRQTLLREGERDALTGLYNKKKYLEMTPRYREAAQLCVLNFDVNNLKTVNDTQGHAAGDLLLRTAADSLVRLCDFETQGYRMGGDEFLLVSVNKSGDELLQLWEQALRRACSAADCSCCMAAGCACGAGGELDALMARADAAMYDDKRRKKAAAQKDDG